MADSMRELDRVEDRIRQHRQVSTQPVLIVEGPDDRLVFKELLSGVAIFPANTKKNVIRATGSLLGQGEVRFAGLVDSDFDDPTEVISIGERLLCYEMRDLEGMLIHLGVLAKVLEFLGSEAKLNAQGGVGAVVGLLVERAMPVANLRFANRVHGWGICFDDTELASKVDRDSLVVNIDNYVASLIRDRPDIERTLVRGSADLAIDDGRGPRGKDVLAVSSVALKKKIGTSRQSEVTETIMVAALLAGSGLALLESKWFGTLDRLLSA